MATELAAIISSPGSPRLRAIASACSASSNPCCGSPRKMTATQPHSSRIRPRSSSSSSVSASACSRYRSPEPKSIATRSPIASARNGPDGSRPINSSASVSARAFSPAVARWRIATNQRRARSAKSAGGVTRKQ